MNDPTHDPTRFILVSPSHAGNVGAQRVAFVFGPERTGLSNEHVYRCHACISVPTDPGYGSLNLAQAVQLVAYDWRQALGGFGVVPRTVDDDLADAAEVGQALLHWQRALEAIGFLDPTAPKKLMPRLQRLVNRSVLTKPELHILRGIAGRMLALAESRRQTNAADRVDAGGYTGKRST